MERNGIKSSRSETVLSRRINYDEFNYNDMTLPPQSPTTSNHFSNQSYNDTYFGQLTALVPPDEGKQE